MRPLSDKNDAYARPLPGWIFLHDVRSSHQGETKKIATKNSGAKEFPEYNHYHLRAATPNPDLFFRLLTPSKDRPDSAKNQQYRGLSSVQSSGMD